MKSRPNKLHELLDVETRRAIERDLVEQPPGRETYEKVWEHYGLADKGISIKTVERYGGMLRTMARNRWIGQLADMTVGRDLAPEIAGLIRSRLFEALACGETAIGDLLKAALAEKSLSESQIKVADWEEKRQQAKKAIAAEAGPDGRVDAATVADMIDRVMRGEDVRA